MDIGPLVVEGCWNDRRGSFLFQLRLNGAVRSNPAWRGLGSVSSSKLGHGRRQMGLLCGSRSGRIRLATKREGKGCRFCPWGSRILLAALSDYQIVHPLAEVLVIVDSYRGFSRTFPMIMWQVFVFCWRSQICPNRTGPASGHATYILLILRSQPAWHTECSNMSSWRTGRRPSDL